MSKKIRFHGSGDWIEGGVRSSFEDADLIVMPGGGDVSPYRYGAKPSSHTRYWSDSRDEEQLNMIEKAIDMGKHLVGICRGFQLLTIRMGGNLIQHLNHPNSHDVFTVDGNSYRANSIHHQLCNVYSLPKEECELIGWTKQLSNVHLMEDDEQLEFPQESLDKETGLFREPEIAIFPRIKALGVQFHPEMMRTGKMVDYLNNLLKNRLGL